MTLILALTTSLSFLLSADATASLEWTPISFVNSKGVDSLSLSCDLTSMCDHVFEFSVSSGSHRLWSQRSEIFWNQNTNIFSNKKFTVSFNKWPKNRVYLTTSVMDSDINFLNPPDFVVSINFILFAQPDPSRHQSNAIEKSINVKGHTFNFKYRVFCDANFYGNDCSKKCVPQDSSTHGHFRCSAKGDIVCLEGWEDEKNMCLTRQDDCEENKCKNGARCQDGNKKYSCICKPGFKGLLCESEIKACESFPCKNGADCVNDVADFVCKCKPGFVGKTCSEKACVAQSPCKNNGTCYGNLKCKCTTHFYGERCTEQLCRKTGCKNGGTCSIHGMCQCPTGMAGSLCDVNLCDYVDGFCRNGGQCVNGKCQCTKQYTGKACELPVACQQYPCKNSARCEVGYNKEKKYFTPYCVCLPGFFGTLCEHQELDGPKKEKNIEVVVPTKHHHGCDQNHIAYFIVLGVIIILLLIVIIVLSVLQWRNRNTKKSRKQYLNSVVSNAESVFSTQESDRNLSSSTVNSVLHDDNEVFTSLDEKPSNKKDELFLASVKHIALPNIYSDDVKNVSELESHYEFLKDEVKVEGENDKKSEKDLKI